MSIAGNYTRKPGKTRQMPVLVDGTSPINQGDLVYLSSGTLKIATTDAEAQYLEGVAKQSNPMAPSPYGAAVYPEPPSLGVEYGCIQFMVGTTGESYANGALVYLASAGTDAQTITTAAGSYAVGKVQLESSDVAYATIAAGTRVPVLIFNRELAAAAQIG